MAKNEIVNKMTRKMYKIGFKFKKHSPEIMVVGGVIGMVGATVMACKATLKVNEVLEEAKENLNKIHEAHEKGATAMGLDYSDEDAKKDTSIVYIQTTVKLARHYAPAALLGGVSIASIITGHNILRKRNLALAAAYTAIDKGFKEYRGRVVERFGKELDRELRYNIKAKEIEEVTVAEDGSEVINKKIIEVADPNAYSEYSRIYDDGCRGWEKDPETNLMVLRGIQAHANDRLRLRGHLFLNEVYDMLGLPRSQAGCVVGWIYDEKNPIGDNFVDFGIYDIHKPKNRDFVNGYERAIILDFNVDGNIMQYL